MPRVKRGKTARKRRKNVLRETKGYRGSRGTKYKASKEALMKAQSYKYRDRRTKKRNMRRLWNIKINAACRKNGTTYRELIYALKNKNIELDRKILSQLAEKHPEIFTHITKEATDTSTPRGK